MNAFDTRETVEISGDVSEFIETYLEEEFGDEVLDFQIYFKDNGEHCVAVAMQARDVVTGGILLVMPKPAGGKDAYELSGVYEDEGPVADFCPQHILDLLSPTENTEANYWRDRCRHRLARDAGHDDAPPVRTQDELWDQEESRRQIGGRDRDERLDEAYTDQAVAAEILRTGIHPGR